MRLYKVRHKSSDLLTPVFLCLLALCSSAHPLLLLLHLWRSQTPPSAHSPLPAHGPCPWPLYIACSLVPLPLPLPPLPPAGSSLVPLLLPPPFLQLGAPLCPFPCLCPPFLSWECWVDKLL
eukprot:1148963-Pelagomonas_calceolata.AAC.2